MPSFIDYIQNNKREPHDLRQRNILPPYLDDITVTSKRQITTNTLSAASWVYQNTDKMMVSLSVPENVRTVSV